MANIRDPSPSYRFTSTPPVSRPNMEQCLVMSTIGNNEIIRRCLFPVFLIIKCHFKWKWFSIRINHQTSNVMNIKLLCFLHQLRGYFAKRATSKKPCQIKTNTFASILASSKNPSGSFSDMLADADEAGDWLNKKNVEHRKYIFMKCSPSTKKWKCLQKTVDGVFEDIGYTSTL